MKELELSVMQVCCLKEKKIKYKFNKFLIWWLDLFSDTTRKETDKLYVVKNEQGFAPGEEGDVQFDSFTIPSAQPTTQGFDCIDILYEIRVTVLS